MAQVPRSVVIGVGVWHVGMVQCHDTGGGGFSKFGFVSPSALFDGLINWCSFCSPFAVDLRAL